MKYAAPEDIVVYSIDEVFMDVTDYLAAFHLTPHALAAKIIQDVFSETGITATAGIGTNLFLCKAAMDIVAKHIPPDENGVRIARLDEMSYRRTLWTHRPLTDFWRVGQGYARKLMENGMFTMGDVALCSVTHEDLLYTLFGKNAELLIDHAWGWEPCTIKDIKNYRPASQSLGSSQVLPCPYSPEKARLVLQEMADLLVLDLTDKSLVTDQLVITVGYDIENLSDPKRACNYRGPVVLNPYGRRIPKHAHGTASLNHHTASAREIMSAAGELFDRIVNPDLLIRRLSVTANHTLPESTASQSIRYEQLDLFTDYADLENRYNQEQAALKREKKLQKTMLAIKKKYGRNSIVRGMSLEEGATARERNKQIGGHKA